MDLKGFDDLIDKFQRMEDNIEGDVDEVIKNNTIEQTTAVLKNQRARFTQGYWTGNMARSTTTEKVASMHWRTYINASYAGYMEFGTRYYQGGTRFMFDAHRFQKPKVIEDLKRLIEG